MNDIKILVMDVDGTLTDGKIYMGKHGELFKAFNIKDGFGIVNILPKFEIEPVIITGRSSNILKKRCIELGIKELYQGISDKLQKLNEILKHRKIDYKNVAYIGDDLNDLTCMSIIKQHNGICGCTNDAVMDVKQLCNFVCSKNGGEGAVREFIEWIINK